jgi:type II secretion system protein G
VGSVDARVVEYVLTYPTNSKAHIKAWIDPVQLRPLKRELSNGRGGGILETLASFENDPETPEATFVTNPTEADKAIARLTNKGCRQITALGQALEEYNEKEGRYPTTAEGLDALINKPKGANNWKGPYLEEVGLLKDPWGNAYAYRFPGLRDPAAYDLSSPVFEGKYNLPLDRLKGLLADDDLEAGVVAALKAIMTAQFTFRSQHMDANGVAGFWVGDVSGLYRFLAAGGEIRLIDRRIAEADSAPLKIKELSKEWPDKPVPYHGCLFSVFSKHLQDGAIKPYHSGGYRNKELFGVVAYPADYPKSGRFTFIIDGNMNILRRDLGGKTIDTCPSDDDLGKWRLPTGD